MISSRISRNFSNGLASKINCAVQFAAAHSVYPTFISIGELTTAQALVLSIFHCLLYEDMGGFLSLLSLTRCLPQLRSSFIGIWLRDDYDFRQEDVAKVLSVLAQFIQYNGPVVPQSILHALSGLEEKYDIFNLYNKTKDTTAQELLAFLNPLITRATQTCSEGIQDKEVQAKPNVKSVAIQTVPENRQQAVTTNLPHIVQQNHRHLFPQNFQPSVPENERPLNREMQHQLLQITGSGRNSCISRNRQQAITTNLPHTVQQNRHQAVTTNSPHTFQQNRRYQFSQNSQPFVSGEDVSLREFLDRLSSQYSRPVNSNRRRSQQNFQERPYPDEDSPFFSWWNDAVDK